MILKIKKGAMFGLDARIALAIFGALSVISGASLYSAIQESKMVSFYNQLTEIEKSIESYYIDTGSKEFLESATADIGVLVRNVNNVQNWSGPYLNANYFSPSLIKFNNDDLELLLRVEGNTAACQSGLGIYSDNYFHIKIDGVADDEECSGDLEYLQQFHDKYDSDGDYTRGKIKVYVSNVDSTKGGVFYRVDLTKVE
jgi:type II secretory pathway pseudopilin PulG